MKKELFISLIAIGSLFSCNTDADLATPSIGDESVSTSGTTLSASIPSSTTKVSYTEAGTEGIKVAWESDDAITIYDASGALVGNFEYSAAGSSDTSAVFEAVAGVSLNVGDTYTAVYPTSTATTLDERNAEFSAETTQAEADNIGHLESSCMMIDEFVYGSSDVALAHETTVITYTFSTTTDEVPSKVVMTDGENSYTVNLDFADESDSYTAYIVIKPSTDSREISFANYYGDGVDVIYRSTSMTWEAGVRYSVNMSIPADYTGTCIYTLAELEAFRDGVNDGSATSVDVMLMNDITLEDEWVPIGGGADYATISFSGTFDGNGRKINGLTITDTNMTLYVGFFGRANGATIKNLTISEPNINIDTTNNNANQLGAVVGLATKSTIENCHSVGGNVIGKFAVGGIAGKSEGSSIYACSNTSAITGTGGSIGGICGFSTISGDVTPAIVLCYNEGAISASGAYAAGVVAQWASGILVSCYNGNGDAVSNTGSYAWGKVYGVNSSGNDASNCYFVGESSDNSSRADYDGIVSKNTITLLNGKIDAMNIAAQAAGFSGYGFKAGADTTVDAPTIVAM